MRADHRISKEISQGREAFSHRDDSWKTSIYVRVPPKPRRSVIDAVFHAIASLKERVIYRMSSVPARHKMEANALDQAIQTLQKANKALRGELGMKVTDATLRPPKRDEYGQPIVLTPAQEYKELQAANFVLRQMVQADAQLIDVLNAVNDRSAKRPDIPAKAQAFFQTLELLTAARPNSESGIAAIYLGRMQGFLQTMKVPVLLDLETAANTFISTGSQDASTRAVITDIRFCARAEILSREAAMGLDKVDAYKLGVIRQDADKLWNEAVVRSPGLRSKDTIPGTGFTLDAIMTLRDDAIDWLTVSNAKAVLKSVVSVGIQHLSVDERAAADAAIQLCKARPKMFSEKLRRALNQYSDQLNPKPQAVASQMPLQAIDNVMTGKKPDAKPVAKPAQQKAKAVAQPAQVAAPQVTTAKVNRATLLKAEQEKVRVDFQDLLGKAMGCMWDPAPTFVGRIDDFNAAAAEHLVDAMKVFDKALRTSSLKLTDHKLTTWTADLVADIYPDDVREIQRRLQAGLLNVLLDHIENIDGVPMGTHAFVEHWAQVVGHANTESA